MDLLRRKPLEECSKTRVWVEGTELELTLIRSRRRRRKLTLQLDAKGGLLVRSPFAARRRDIDSLIQRNSAWILQRRQDMQRQQYRNPDLCFADGETHLYLGQRYTLKINELSASRRVSIVLHDGELLISPRANPSTPEAISQALQQWYKQQAQVLFARRLAFFTGQLAWVSELPELRLRRMRSRWGSCSSSGKLCLNTHLIKASERCIDYVIVHELCHLQEFNHSPRFYALMDAALPDWRARKAELEACGAAIIRE